MRKDVAKVFDDEGPVVEVSLRVLLDTAELSRADRALLYQVTATCEDLVRKEQRAAATARLARRLRINLH